MKKLKQTMEEYKSAKTISVTSFICRKARNGKIPLILLAMALGSIGGLIVWLFFHVMTFGLWLLWEVLPQRLDFAYYPVLICILGGLLIGVCQNKFGEYPQKLDKVLDVIKEKRRYDYKRGITTNALLPLIFGGSIGPEAGLAGVIAGYVAWMGDCYQCVAEEAMTRKKKYILASVAVLCGIAVVLLLWYRTGIGLNISHFEQSSVSSHEILWFFPLTLVGCLAGYFCHLSGKLGALALKPIKRTILRAVIGGVLLGLGGMYLPLALFSGEAHMGTVISDWASMPMEELILIGIVKIVLLNICLMTGWHGGPVFPLLFAGICLGCGMALLTDVDGAFAAAVVSAALCGAALRKPLIVAPVLLVCFPLQSLVYIAPAAFLGSLAPLPAVLKA